MFIKKIIHNLIKVIIRKGIIYPTPSNLNNFWAFGSLLICLMVIQIILGILLAIYYISYSEHAFDSVEHILRNVSFVGFIRWAHLIGGVSLLGFFLYMFLVDYKILIMYFIYKNFLFIYYKKDFYRVKVAICIIFIVNIALKILVWFSFPVLFSFNGFIFIDFVVHGFIILIYFIRFLPYLVGVIGFHLPIYIWMCDIYWLQCMFIKWEIIEFSWLFHTIIPDGAYSLYFSMIVFFIYIFEFRADLGFCAYNLSEDSETVKNKLLFILLYLFSINLMIHIQFDCPWIYFACSKNFLKLELVLLVLIFIRVFPIVIIPLGCITFLWVYSIISNFKLYLLVLILWKVYSIYLWNLLVVYSLQGGYTSKIWYFWERLALAMSILFMLNILWYITVTSKFILFHLNLLFVAEPEIVNYLNLDFKQINLTEDLLQGKVGINWLDRITIILRDFIAELKNVFSDGWDVDEETDVDYNNREKLRYYDLDGVRYKVYSNLYIKDDITGVCRVLIDDKYSFIRAYVLKLNNFRENFYQHKFVNSIIVSIKHNWNFGYDLNMFQITQLVCLTFWLLENYRDGKNLGLVNLLCGLLIINFLLFDHIFMNFFIFQGNAFMFEILMNFFFEGFWLIWLYFLGELIFKLIKLIKLV